MGRYTCPNKSCILLTILTAMDVPWVFSGEATKATDGMVDRWPYDHRRFQRAFQALMEVPERSTGLSADLTNNNYSPPTIITEWDAVAEKYQGKFLHELMSEVGLDVQNGLREAQQLDRQLYMLCFHREAFPTKLVIDQQKYTGPPAPGYVCHVWKSQPRGARIHTPIVSYATTSANNIPQSSLESRFQILLS
ncbi:hypothetical protein RUND412_002810 [Rhizina undulata]